MTGDTMALWWNPWGKTPAIVVASGNQKNGNGGANQTQTGGMEKKQGWSEAEGGVKTISRCDLKHRKVFLAVCRKTS